MKMAALLLSLFGLFIAICAEKSLIIPGTGCGNVPNLWRALQKLPEDNEELRQLACVKTTDAAGYERWKATRTTWHWRARWSPCSVTCGGGIQLRERECRNATHVLTPQDCQLDNDLINVTRTCNPEDCFPCGSYEAQNPGTYLNHTDGDSLGACFDTCAGDVGCEFYNYNSVIQRCYLLRDGGNGRPNYNAAIQSAAKHCDMTDKNRKSLYL